MMSTHMYIINHWFKFGFTKKFKAVSTKYCCTLCNRSFFCFHNLCRWICKLVNLHMYLFLFDHHFKSGQIFDVFSLDHHFKPGPGQFDGIFFWKLVSDHFTDTLTNGGWSLKTYRCSILHDISIHTYYDIYSQRVLFYPENILVDYVCRFGFNLWILDFIDFCETTSDHHFLLYNVENKVLICLLKYFMSYTV